MRRYKFLIVLFIACSLSAFSLSAFAQRRTMRSGVPVVDVYSDGVKLQGGWRISPQINPDVYETTASTVVFASDVDTLYFNLPFWEHEDFDVITAGGDTAHTRVSRIAGDIYANPNPALTKPAPSGLLSREQASFDIDAMAYTLMEVHPNLFAKCNQQDFFKKVNEAKATLPDSISKPDLYRRLAPIVAMIGDGHTSLWFPYNSVFTKELKRMPIFLTVTPDKSLTCLTCIDSIVPKGSQVLSINGMPAAQIVESMIPFVSGEKEFFRLRRVDGDFHALYQMLYPAETFDVEYIKPDTRKKRHCLLTAETIETIRSRRPAVESVRNSKPYSYRIDDARNIGIMDFNSCVNVGGMAQLCDSMFRELRNKGIHNLIIDVRQNGGGNSAVGDVLLKYIAKEPFVQMDRWLVRVTPTTQRLIGERIAVPTMFTYGEADPKDYIKPLSADENHFDGNVYLLTSNRTFSSGSSFAWTYKESGCGKTIGEETGGMNVAFGDILTYRLPVSGLNCSISFKRFWQFRADESDIHGTLPDYPTSSDEAMAKVLDIIRKQTVSLP